MASQVVLFDSTVTLPGDETSFPGPQDNPKTSEEHAGLTVLRLLKHTLCQDIPHIPIDYKLRREQDTPRPHALGRGTFCDVFTHVVKGHEALSVPNIQCGDVVALKRHQPRDPSSAALKVCLAGIRRELDLALHPSLRCHRNICHLLYIGWESRSLIPILAFPTATYGTLEDFLCGSSSGRGTVEAAVRAVLTSDISCGLLALHNHGFVHRDLKMTNILVDECPVSKVRAVLTDFSGSIRQSCGSSTPNDGHGHITPKWAAPEELAGERIDQYSRCDVYSFGLVIVTLWMTGYTRPDLSFPSFLSSLVAKAEEEDPRHDRGMGIKDVRCLQDDKKHSPLQLATDMFEPDSIPARVIRLTLRREPLERAQTQRIVQELHKSTFDNTSDKDDPLDETSADIAPRKAPLSLLSALATFQNLPRDVQITFVDEMMRVIEELIQPDTEPGCTLELPPALPPDNISFWAFIESLDGSIRLQPFGPDQNAALAHLALDIALCVFYGLGRTKDANAALKWIRISAALGDSWAMIMLTPVALSVDDKTDTSPFRPYLILSAIKGFRRSHCYLQSLFPADYEALKVMTPSESRGSLFSEAESGCITTDRGGKQFDIDDELVRVSKTYMECSLIGCDTHTTIETTLSHPSFQISKLSSFPDQRMWHFWQDVRRLEEAIRCLITEQRESAEDHIIANSHRLFALTSIYTTQYTALAYRVCYGANYLSRQIEHLKCLLTAGADPSHHPGDNISTLSVGLMSNNIAIIETLTSGLTAVSKNVILNAMNEITQALGKPIGELCVGFGWDQTLDWLLAQKFLPVDQLSAEGKSLLNFAASRGNRAIISVLLKHGASLYQGYNKPFLLPFTKALVDGHDFDTALLLLPSSHEERQRLFKTVNANGFTCFGTVLTVALESTNITLNTIESLVAIGAIDLIVKPSAGTTVFDVFFAGEPAGQLRRDFSSLESGIFDLLLRLFRQHINDPLKLTSTIAGGTLAPLHVAVWRANFRAVESMLLLGYPELDVNARTGHQGDMTVFDLAAYRKNNVPEYIRKAGDPEISTFQSAMVSIIEVLKAHGAEPGNGSSLTLNMLSLRESMERKMIMAHWLPAPGEDGYEEVLRRIFAFTDGAVMADPDILDRYRGDWPRKWRDSV